MNRFAKFETKTISGDNQTLLLNVDKISKIEYFQDNYFSKPYYFIYIDGVSLSGTNGFKYEDFIKVKTILERAIGVNNIYE